MFLNSGLLLTSPTSSNSIGNEVKWSDTYMLLLPILTISASPMTILGSDVKTWFLMSWGVMPGAGPRKLAVHVT